MSERPSADQLLEAARKEAPTPEAARRGLDAVLDGTVEPLGIDGPTMEPKGLPWLLLTVLLLSLVTVGLLVFKTFGGTNVQDGVGPLAIVFDAGALQPTPLAEPVELDAGSPSEVVAPVVVAEPVDAGQPAPKPKPSARPVVEDDSLARELALLDEARVALGTNPAGALDVLDRHRRLFPKGTLQLEARLLRVETLLKLGRRAEAAALAKQLTKADREGLVRERLERLLPP